ncbi:hypothetical protein G9A89_000145 [Geosiphon pyriformis]|nr:hypothetical protein G9A89_000145 [Geosiphon pyriformis]
MEYERYKRNEEGTEVAIKFIKNSEEGFKEYSKGNVDIETLDYVNPQTMKQQRQEKQRKRKKYMDFAMLLRELATGKPPFHDRSHDHLLIMNILNGQRHKIISPLIPPCIAKIIEKCLDANLKNRPTAEEFGDRLWKFYDMMDKKIREIRVGNGKEQFDNNNFNNNNETFIQEQFIQVIFLLCKD